MEPPEHGRFDSTSLIARIGQGSPHNFHHHLRLMKDARRIKSNSTAGTSIYQYASSEYQTNVCTRFTTSAFTPPFSGDNDYKFTTNTSRLATTASAPPFSDGSDDASTSLLVYHQQPRRLLVECDHNTATLSDDGVCDRQSIGTACKIGIAAFQRCKYF